MFTHPIGFLGLLAIIVLIIIYIIKQNFQQKIVSSTYVWKLSLKYRKKRIPINKFRNLLIFLCQVLAITACAFILAWPLINSDITAEENEKIFIIDAAANMLAIQDNGSTRFENAIEEAREYGIEAIGNSGLVSVILAGDKANFEIIRTGSQVDFEFALDLLYGSGDLKCTYGVSDISGAIGLAEIVLKQNALSEVVLYTATTYVEKGTINVVNLDESKMDWNMAVLDASTFVHDNVYIFDIEVASFNRDAILTVSLNFTDIVTTQYKVSEKMLTFDYSFEVYCTANKSQSFRVTRLDKNPDSPADPEEEPSAELRVVSFNTLRVSIVSKSGSDAFPFDNELNIYGERKDDIKVLYTSTRENPFVLGLMASLRAATKNRWSISTHNVPPENGEYVLEGYDFYIFEEEMPEVLPVDGVVFCLNPDTTPTGLGLAIGDEIELDTNAMGEIGATLTNNGVVHDVIKGLNPGEIHVSRYREVLAYNGYEALWFVSGSENLGTTNSLHPVLLTKNEEDIKIAVLSFGVQYSDFAMKIDYPKLLINLYNYFIPSTVEKFMYNVGEEITVTRRGLSLKINGTEFSEDVVTIVPASYGTITIEQKLLRSNAIDAGEQFSSTPVYVRIAKTESDFSRMELELKAPELEEGEGDPVVIDLVTLIASILVGLLFVEWWLQSRERG